MKIVVDARALIPQPSGIGRYTDQVLEHLHDGEDQWILCSPTRLPDRWQVHERVELYQGKHAGRLAKLDWLTRRLPRTINAVMPDLVWGPGHRLPNGLDQRIAQVVTIHDLVWKIAPQTMPRLGLLMDQWRMPGAIRQADAIIAVSEATGAAIMQHFPAASDKVHVVLNGVTSLGEPAPEQRLTELGIEAGYLLFVGTPEPRKNLSRIIDAFAQLPDSVQLVIAGGRGWGGVDSADLARRAGVSARVRTVGFADDPTLSLLYRHARALLMPSLYEGFGLPLLEAMSVGVPVITANRASMPEVAGDAGLLVDPESEEQIRDAMRRLLEDDALATRLGENGRRRASALSWDACARQTRQVFELACERCARHNRTTLR